MATPSSSDLPADFAPVRYAIPDEAKNALRGRVTAEDPILVTLSNEGQTASLVATANRLFVIKTGQMGMNTLGGSVTPSAQIREFPWEGVTHFTMTPMTYNVKFTLSYRTSNGKTVEVGIRARMGKPASEHVAAFETVAAEEAFAALTQLWNLKRTASTELG